MEKEAVNKAIAEAVGFDGLFESDLNAMHEAEKVLDDVGQRKFAMTLHEMTRADLTFGKGLNYWAVIHTTARQRAEAFLRTMGKWKE